jgi:hypothetical protein
MALAADKISGRECIWCMGTAVEIKRNDTAGHTATVKENHPATDGSGEERRSARAGGGALRKLPDGQQDERTADRRIKGDGWQPHDVHDANWQFKAAILERAVIQCDDVFGVVVVVSGRGGLGGVGGGIKHRNQSCTAQAEDNQPPGEERRREDGGNALHARDNTQRNGKFNCFLRGSGGVPGSVLVLHVTGREDRIKDDCLFADNRAGDYFFPPDTSEPWEV